MISLDNRLKPWTTKYILREWHAILSFYWLFINKAIDDDFVNPNKLHILVFPQFLKPRIIFLEVCVTAHFITQFLT